MHAYYRCSLNTTPNKIVLFSAHSQSGIGTTSNGITYGRMTTMYALTDLIPRMNYSAIITVIIQEHEATRRPSGLTNIHSGTTDTLRFGSFGFSIWTNYTSFENS